MTATNHGLMGIVIGAFLPMPLAIPLALLSHFVMDALPHYGIPQKQRNTSKIYKKVVAIDTITALLFAVLAASFGKWAMFWVGWVAYSPDFMWVISYFRHNNNLHMRPKNFITKFHKNIQRYERPWGAYVEIVLFLLLLPTTLHLFLT
jgi:hypothetical protein